MSSRVQKELQDLRRGLEKAVKEDSTGMISDILANISTVTMTAELIKKSKLGKELIGVVSKYKTSSDPSEVLISEKADEILNGFKKIVSESQESNKKAELIKRSPAIPERESQKSTSSVEDSANGASSSSSSSSRSISSLSSLRQKIVKTFCGIFSPHCSMEQANALSFDIENAINAIHSQVSEEQQYKAKCTTLMLNIKKNQEIKLDLINGSLHSDRLVTLTSQELATPNIRRALQQNADKVSDSYRLDWGEEKKAEIASSYGIDVTDDWLYDEDDKSDDGIIECAD